MIRIKQYNRNKLGKSYNGTVAEVQFITMSFFPASSRRSIRMSKQDYPAQGPPQALPPAYSATSGAGAPPPHPNAAAAQPMYNPPPQTEKPKKSGGMFGSFMKEMDKVGKQISKGIDSASKKVDQTVDQNWSSLLLDMFKHGNTVQLVSRSSGRTMQIVMSPARTLVLDAMGPLDPTATNSLWMVVNEGSNQVRLHNYNNFIAVIKGQTVVVPVPIGSAPGPETKFQLSQTQNFIMLESLTELNCHVGFLNTGELKTAAITHKEINSQFGVKLVSTAYPEIQPVQK